MKIGIVVFDGIIPFHLSVPFAVFEKVLAPSGAPLCELTLCAAEPGELKTNAGFSIVVNLGLGALSGMNMVIVPSWDDPARQPEPALLDAMPMLPAPPSSAFAWAHSCWRRRAC